MAVHESDVCVIGGGITAAMLIERLAELKPGLRITAVEAGRAIFDRGCRGFGIVPSVPAKRKGRPKGRPYGG